MNKIWWKFSLIQAVQFKTNACKKHIMIDRNHFYTMNGGRGREEAQQKKFNFKNCSIFLMCCCCLRLVFNRVCLILIRILVRMDPISVGEEYLEILRSSPRSPVSRTHSISVMTSIHSMMGISWSVSWDIWQNSILSCRWTNVSCYTLIFAACIFL